MRRALLVAVLVALAGASSAPAARPWSPAAPGFRLVGVHGLALMRGWAASSRMPLPAETVFVGVGDPMAPWGGNEIDLPECCALGWSHLAIEGDFFHELGHLFDRLRMTPELRAEFRTLAGLPASWPWWRPVRTIRWVTGPGYVIRIAPGEVFAEEYAACSLGLTQRGYQDAGFNSYGWVPPAGTDESALCGLIERAGVPHA